MIGKGDLHSWRTGLSRLFSRDAWVDEAKVAHRHGRALMFLLAGLITIGAFVQPSNGYIAVCFAALAVFCALNGLRLGVLVCLAGLIRWGLRSRNIVGHDDSADELLMLLFMGLLGLVFVWKADELGQLRRASGESE